MADHPPGFATGIAHVIELRWRTPRLRLVRISAPELATMDTGVGPAPAVRLLLPPPGSPVVLPTVTIDGLAYPPDADPPTPRTLTIRRHDAERATLDVEVAVHADGVLGRWAATVESGSQVGFAGPRHFRPLLDDGPLVLLGDETAVPAIASIAEARRSVGSGPVAAIIEVASATDELDLGLSVTWRRRGERSHGLALLEAARAVDVTGGALVWVAGEAAMVRAVRSVLVARGISPERVRACGYWRAGTSSNEVDDVLLRTLQELTARGADLDVLDEFALVLDPP